MKIFDCFFFVLYRWAEIAKQLPGRTGKKLPFLCHLFTCIKLYPLFFIDNNIKNHWNSSIRRKIEYYFSKVAQDVERSIPDPVDGHYNYGELS